MQKLSILQCVRSKGQEAYSKIKVCWKVLQNMFLVSDLSFYLRMGGNRFTFCFEIWLIYALLLQNFIVAIYDLRFTKKPNPQIFTFLECMMQCIVCIVCKQFLVTGQHALVEIASVVILWSHIGVGNYSVAGHPNPCDCGDNPNVDLAPNNDWEDLDGPTELQRGVHYSSGALLLLSWFFCQCQYHFDLNEILISAGVEIWAVIWWRWQTTTQPERRGSGFLQKKLFPVFVFVNTLV